ncbi:oxidoreductase [Photobacterium aquae]|uniref:Oxidoreductase n=1 Tax=Photobacterium aquae TaxID=1195763 RepID=A0A0J1GV35_9GAMM|nr:alpha/beta hydrolase [Photobacterium aquae]KLV03595.1 oxidoreductase [Photobacterium aquae]
MVSLSSGQATFIDIDDARLAVTQHGNEKGEPLILLHGGLGCQHDLLPLHPYIPAHYAVFSIDLRGHGQSTLGDVPLSYAQYQRDIEQVIATLNLDTFSILGFSDGGIVGYRLAAANPSRVKKLITIGSQWRLENNDPSTEILAGLTTEDWIAMFPDSIERYFYLNPMPDFEKLVTKIKTLWLDQSNDGYPHHYVSKIQCPTLVIRGDKDFLFSLEEATALQARLNDKASFMNIPFAEHEAHKEQPKLCGMAIKQFLTT